jgi:hypothetical protein
MAELKKVYKSGEREWPFKNGATRDATQVKKEERTKGKRVHGAGIGLVRQ